MIPVYRIKVPKAVFQKMQEDERLSLILLGHMFNQMAVQFKMLRLSMNNDAPDEIEQSVSAAQTHILLRLFLGGVFETWEAINIRILKQPIWEKFFSRISTAGQDGVKILQEHFSDSNLLAKIRNNVAYHYPNDKVLRKAFDATGEEESWEWCLAHEITNSFYFLSDVVVSYSFIAITGEPDATSAFKIVMGEVAKVANALNDFMMALMQAIAEKYFPEAKREIVLKVQNAPDARIFFIPFYAEDKPSQADLTRSTPA
jgi:hypothetical protein